MPSTVVDEDIRVDSSSLPGSGHNAPGFLTVLVETALAKHHRDHREDLNDWLLSNPDLPETLLLRLSDQPELATILGHRKGPRSLLERLATRYGQDEAILTLAKDLYTSPQRSESALRSFLREYQDHAWMLASLAGEIPSCMEKEMTYLEAIAAHPDREKWIAIVESRREEAAARDEADPENLSALYATKRPRVLRALAENRYTPEPILEELLHVKATRYARAIRSLAAENLHRRRKPNAEQASGTLDERP